MVSAASEGEKGCVCLRVVGGSRWWLVMGGGTTTAHNGAGLPEGSAHFHDTSYLSHPVFAVLAEGCFKEFFEKYC